MTRAKKVVAIAGAVVVVGGAGYAGLKFANRNGGNAPQAPAAQAGVAANTDGTPSSFEVPLVSKWEVSYIDSALGEVTGTASINWETSDVRVTVIDPRDGKSFTLTTRELSLDQKHGILAMRVRGQSPAAPAVAKPPATGQLIAAEGGQAVKVDKADPVLDTKVLEKDFPESDGVHLTLVARNFGILDGEWSYLSDPITKRDAQGGGRSGHFRMLEREEHDSPNHGFLGVVSGTERWTPLPAEIDATFVLEDQLSFEPHLPRRAAYRYPFAGPNTVETEGLKRRTLFVVGRNFPFDGDRLLHDADLDDHVFAWSGQRDISAKNKALLDAGWEKALEPIAAEQRTLVRSRLDAALISVTVKPDMRPGPKTVWWGEASDTWFLQYGDNTAEAWINRRIRQKTAQDPNSADQYERTSVVFLPEEIAVEINVRLPLPIAAVPVHIRTSGGAEITRDATPVPGSPGRYRTPLFSVGKAGSSAALAVSPGQTIDATVRMDDVAFVTPPLARATAYLTPDRIQGPLVATAKDAAVKVRLWKEALQIVALSRGWDTGDLSAVVGKSADTYRGVAVTGGEQAALLLLRSAFLTQMLDQEAFLNGITTDDQVEGFRQWLMPMLAGATPKFVAAAEPPVGWEKYPDYLKAIDQVNALQDALRTEIDKAVSAAFRAVFDPRAPRGDPNVFGRGTYFGELPVPSPNPRVSWPFYTTYGDWSLFRDRFKGDRNAFRNWQIRAGREVLAAYRRAVFDAAVKYRTIETNDVAGLVDLAGIAYGPMVQTLLPTLMRLDAAGKWEADLPARAAVGGLHELSAAAIDAKSYRGLQKELAITIGLQLLSLVNPQMILGGIALKVFNRVSPYGLFAWQAGSAIRDQVLVREEIDTFFGTASVLGTAQLDQAALRESNYFAIIAKLALEKGIAKVKGVAVNEAKAAAGQAVVSALPERLVPTWNRLNSAITWQSVKAAVPFLHRMSWSEVKKWPKSVVQGILEGAANAEAAILRRVDLAPRQLPNIGLAPRPLPVVDVIARAEVRRLAESIESGTADKAPATVAKDGPAPTVIWNQVPPALVATVIPSGEAGKATELPPGQVETKIEVYQPANAARLTADLAKTQVQVGAPPPPPTRNKQIPVTLPPRPSWMRVVHDDGADVEFHLVEESPGVAKPLGGGASSGVYIIRDVKGRDAATTDRILGGNGSVIKIVYPSKDFGTAKEQVVRMKEAYELLKAVAPHVLVAEVLEFHPNASQPYLVQRKLKFGEKLFQIDRDELVNMRIKVPLHDNAHLMINPALDFKDVQKVFRPEYQKALLRLYSDLAKVGLVSPDLSLPNVYFDTNSGVRAGILDIDHIVRLADAKLRSYSVTWNWLGMMGDAPKIYMPSRLLDGRPITDAMTFMEKVLETPMGGNRKNPFLIVNPRTLEMQPNLIDPAFVPDFFPNFRTRVEEVRPPEKSATLQPRVPWLVSLQDVLAGLWRRPVAVPAFAR